MQLEDTNWYLLYEPTFWVGVARAQFLPPRQQFQQGYDAGQVDRFFASLTEAVDAGESIVQAILKHRFEMARRGHSGYDVTAVDKVLDRVGTLAAADDRSSRHPLPSVQQPRPSAPDRVVAGRIILALGVALIVLVVVVSVL